GVECRLREDRPDLVGPRFRSETSFPSCRISISDIAQRLRGTTPLVSPALRFVPIPLPNRGGTGAHRDGRGRMAGGENTRSPRRDRRDGSTGDRSHGQSDAGVGGGAAGFPTRGGGRRTEPGRPAGLART